MRAACLAFPAFALLSACDNAPPEVVYTSPKLCSPGLKVMTPAGNAGTVTKAEESGCTVTDDATGEANVWAEFMLAPVAGSSALTDAPPGPPKPGWYRCEGGAAGAFRVQIRTASTYADSIGERGDYAFDPVTADISWTNGPLAGLFSRVEKSGAFSIHRDSSRSMLGSTCRRDS